MELLADVTEGGLDEHKGLTLDVVGDSKKYFLLVETKNERRIMADPTARPADCKRV